MTHAGCRMVALGLLLAGCADFALPGVKRPGRFQVVFSWESQRPGANEVLWVTGRVTETANGAAHEVSQAGPERYQPGMQLNFSAVDNCDACVVAVEFREGQGSQAPGRYYGISQPFALHPNDDVTVDVRVALRGVPSTSGLTLAVRVVGGSTPASQFNSPLVDVVVGRANGATAPTALLSNLPSFPEDDPQATAPRTATQTFAADVAVFASWDLLRGRSQACDAPGDCPLRVFARLRDAEGYPSDPVFVDVVWDRTPPQLAVAPADGGVVASVRPSQPAGPELITVQFSTHEPCLDTATVDVEGAADFAFLLSGVRQDPAGTTYSFVALNPASALPDMAAHTLRATFTDVAGNTTQASVGTVQLDPNALRLVDGGAVVQPRLADGGALAPHALGGWFLTRGDVVDLQVAFSRPLDGVPAVRFGARDPFVDGGLACDPGATTCTGSFEVLPGDPDGEQRITVVAKDRTERDPVSFEISRAITVDQTPPMVDFLWSTPLVRNGGEVVLITLADEPVAWEGAPPVLLGPPPAMLPLPSGDGGVPAEGVQATWRATMVVDPAQNGALDGPWVLNAASTAWRDRARNPAVLTSPGGVTLDSTPPQVLTANVTPQQVGAATPGPFQVTANAGGDVAMVVAQVGISPQDRCTLAPDGAGGWTCALPIPPALADGLQPLTITAVDLAGNSATRVVGVEVDRRAPQFSYDRVFYDPAPNNPLDRVTAATAGTRVNVVLASDELVDSLAVYLDVPGYGRVDFQVDEFEPPTAVGFFSLVVDPALPSGSFEVKATMVDRFGNPNAGNENLGVVLVRNHVPTLWLDQDQLTLLRQPTGGPVTVVGATPSPGGTGGPGGGSSGPTPGSGSSGGVGGATSLGTAVDDGNVAADATGMEAVAGAIYTVVQSAGLGGVRLPPATNLVALYAPSGGFAPAPPVRLRIWSWPGGGVPGSILKEVDWVGGTGPAVVDLSFSQAPGRGVLLQGVDEAGNLSTLLPVMHTELDIKPIFSSAVPHATTMVATNVPARHPLQHQEQDLGLGSLLGAAELATADADVVQRRPQRHFTHIPVGPSVPYADGWSGAFDPARDRFVVLTTNPFTSASLLMEWDGLSWSAQSLPPSVPSGWVGAAAAYDPVLGGVVFAGGCASRGAVMVTGTWVWDGGTMRQEDRTFPGDVAYAALVYDPQRAELLMMGGTTGCDPLVRHTANVLVHDGAGWQDLGDVPSMGARARAGAVYAGGRVHVVGGTGGNDVRWFNRTSGAFETLTEVGSPGWPRAGHAVFSLPDGRVCLVGGMAAVEMPGTVACFPSGGPSANWQRDATLPSLAANANVLGWADTLRSRAAVLLPEGTSDKHRIYAINNPAQPAVPLAVVDIPAAPTLSWVTRQGGQLWLLGPVGDLTAPWRVHRWNGFTWTNPEDVPKPPYDGSSFTALPLGGLGFYGGMVSTSLTSPSADMVARGVGGDPTWKAIVPTGALARAFHSAAYDSTRDITVIFGGLDETLMASNVTSHIRGVGLALDYQVQTILGPSPPARTNAGMAYGRVPVPGGLDRVVLYGGMDQGGNVLNDVWTYDPVTVTWTQVLVTGIPPRQHHTLVFEDGTDCFVSVGGDGGSGGVVPPETTNSPVGWLCWSNLGWSWQSKPVRGELPPPVGAPGAAYDTTRRHTVVRGGAGAQPLDGTWVLQQPSAGPAAFTMVGDLGDSQLTARHAQEVRVVANTVMPDGGPPTGALHVWSSGPDAGAGGWVAAQPAGVQDVTLPAAQLVLNAPAGPAVAAQVRATVPGDKVALDALEVRARFCQRADGGVCTGTGP